MHTIEWNAVNCGFGLAERREQLPGARLLVALNADPSIKPKISASVRCS